MYVKEKKIEVGKEEERDNDGREWQIKGKIIKKKR